MAEVRKTQEQFFRHKNSRIRCSLLFAATGNMHQTYYRYHVFFCINQRTGGEPCCADKGAVAMRDYAKDRVKALGLAGQGQVRINQAGCLDRCAQGPLVALRQSCR